METSPARFDAATVDQSKLETAFVDAVTLALVFTPLAVALATNVARPFPGPFGLAVLAAVLLVGSTAGALAVAAASVGEALRCRRAPGVLAGAEGVQAEAVAADGAHERVLYAGPDLGGGRLYFTTLGPDIGEPGTLYRRGKVAVFVSGAGAYWAV